MVKLAHAELHESEEYEDVILRVSTSRGSIPVIIMNQGKVSTTEEIGQQIMALFEYLIQSDLIPSTEVSADARQVPPLGPENIVRRN